MAFIDDLNVTEEEKKGKKKSKVCASEHKKKYINGLC